MSSSPAPRKIQLNKPDRQLVVEWDDGVHSRFPWSFLRSHCPSADEEVERQKSAASPLHVLGRVPSSDVTAVRVVGSYAVNIAWADGHDSGIYTWEYLRGLHPRLEASQL